MDKIGYDLKKEMLPFTKKSDPVLYELAQRELDRQQYNIEMIASESTVPMEVMELSGSVFTNKTLEGYPGNRYQAGSGVADELELLLNERTKEVYGCDHVNHQPYSGSTANYSVYASVLSPGDKVLSMRLDQGGHLTHGHPVNLYSKFYQFSNYGVNAETEQIDYEEMEKKAKELQPKLIIAGGSSYPRIIDYERIASIAKANGSLFMVDMAHVSGLVGANVIPSPVPWADFVTSSTTKTFCGPRSGMVMCKGEFAKALDKGVFPGSLGSIHLTTMAAKAWSMNYMKSDEFRQIMGQVVKNSSKLALELENNGFRIVSGGSDNHIVMVDLRPKQISGRQFQDALDHIGLTVNKNQIPNDPASPFVTSGVRIGTTCVSQRGMKEAEMTEIAGILNQVAENIDNETVLAEVKNRARKIIEKFPIYSAVEF
ncbi:MAG: serine hydroxymethyltransferase [Clostridiaceae bacterium]